MTMILNSEESKTILKSPIPIDSKHSITVEEVLKMLEVQRISIQFQAAIDTILPESVAAIKEIAENSYLWHPASTDVDELIDLIRDKMTQEQKDVFDSIENEFNALHYKPAPLPKQDSAEIELNAIKEWVSLNYGENFDTEPMEKQKEWVGRYLESHNANDAEVMPAAPAA